MSDDGQFSDYEEDISKQVKSVRVSYIVMFYGDLKTNVNPFYFTDLNVIVLGINAK